MEPFRALLVEGTSGIGKSTLIDALLRRHVSGAEPRRIRTLVHLAQSHTYGPLAAKEDSGALTVDDNLRHLERIVGHLEWLHACVQEHGRPWCLVVVDTLHLTHCVRPGVVGWKHVSPFDRRLAALGCKLLFLHVAPSTLWERSIQARMETEFLRVYARKFGRTEEEIRHYFVSEQQSLGGLFAQSAMSKRLLQNDGALESALDEAHRFWIGDLPGTTETFGEPVPLRGRRALVDAQIR